MGDGGLGRGDRCVGRSVAVVFRAEGRVVHAHAADEGALAAHVAERREEVRRGDVDGGIVGSAGGAVGQGARDDAVVGDASLRRSFVGAVSVGLFQRKGIFLEPVEQGRRAEDAGIRILRGVDMSVCDISVIST